MNITLYTTSDDPLVADKTLSNGSSVTGTFRGTADVLRPVVTVSASVVNSTHNYAYIPDFGRYYYITGKRFITSELVELSLYTDVRKSFLLALLGNSGVVSRQTNNYDMYLPDNMIPVGAHKSTNVYKFGETPFKGGSDNRVVMLVLGGG